MKKNKTCECCHRKILNIGKVKRCSSCSIYVRNILAQLSYYRRRCQRLEQRLMIRITNPKMIKLIESKNEKIN